MNDRIAKYSPISELIDITAPSSSTQKGPYGHTNIGENIWTMDSDTLGLNPYPFSNNSVVPQGEELPDSSSQFHLSFTGRFSGTSAATPMVAGVAALVLSVNPCLSNLMVKDILLSTADKVGGYNYNWNSAKPGHSKELGYGRVNAYNAVKAAQVLQADSFDLYIKDVVKDFGEEPDTVADYLYISPDIWVRDSADGFTYQYHENPTYDSLNPVYVYVRVRNKSCEDALSGDSVALYWSKAATALNWPDYWDGSINSPVLMGGGIDTLTVDTLLAGKDKILQFTWYPPNPNNYVGINPEHWHFCLLARVLSDKDTMTYPEDSILWSNVKNNNNIAWKNISIIDPHPFGGAPDEGVGAEIAMGSDDPNETKTIELKFFENENTLVFGDPLIEDAELTVTLDSLAYALWEDGATNHPA